MGFFLKTRGASEMLSDSLLIDATLAVNDVLGMCITMCVCICVCIITSLIVVVFFIFFFMVCLFIFSFSLLLCSFFSLFCYVFSSCFSFQSSGDKTKKDLDLEITKKTKSSSELIKKYVSNTLSENDIKRVLDSISDNEAYLSFNVL